jgi:hypothetical protein
MHFDREVKQEENGDDVRLLHTFLALLDLEVPSHERHQAHFGGGTVEVVRRFQRMCGLEPTGIVDPATSAAIAKELDAKRYTVTGTVRSPDRAGVGGLRVVIVDRQIDRSIKLGKTHTDLTGAYAVHFSALGLAESKCNKTKPDLQARVYVGDTLLATSATRYNATQNEVLDVMLPDNAVALQSEWESLIAALDPHCIDLANLHESGDRQDITYLANKSGWDGRLVAMAALAFQLARKNGVPALVPALYYGLFRTGVPMAADSLYQVKPAATQKIWELAIQRGVIPTALTSSLLAAVNGWATLVQAHAVDVSAPAGMGTVKDLAQVALGNDPQKLQQFASIYAQHAGDWPTFWQATTQAFGSTTAQSLQLIGQLNKLTLGNAALIAQVHAAEQQTPLATMADLANRGYYAADKWKTVLGQAPVPTTIAGDTDDAKRTAYANLLAARVRLQFPTAVVAAQVRASEIPLSQSDSATRDAVHSFLTTHVEKFGLDKQPVEQYIARNQLQVPKPVVDEIKRIQRVYQITPSDTAMTGLLQNNIHSAYQIARSSQTAFVRDYANAVGGADTAQLVWARARQIHNTVMNIATHYVIARTAPQIGVHSPGQIVNQTPQGGSSDVIAYPTLEQLFGSMDYCACDHCRSILSPAAYLVDLLRFLDHNPPDKTTRNPQAVLFGRRPDINYLKLSCENTNTPMPYIDVVNETLEYFVSHAKINSPPSLLNYFGHETDATVDPAELLASPQFVDEAAYEALRIALFPAPLPFHKSLETLRRYFAKLGTPLGAAMETLRADDAVERANDASYAWRDILMERLAFSREEYQLLVDQTLTVRHLYGYDDDDSNAAVPPDLANVETFARRTRLSYTDLIAIMKTRFVNPSSSLISRIELLGVPFSILRDLHNGTLTSVDFGKLLPRKLDPAVYAGDPSKLLPDGSNYDQLMGDTVMTWLASGTTYDQIMALITISNPKESSNLCAVDALELRYANPDTSANQLTAIDYVRLARFIRLWRKLGWSVPLIDSAVTSLSPPDSPDGKSPLDHLDAAWKVLLPRLGIVRSLLDVLHLDVERDLPGLLACWAPIETHGDDSLYRRMFLSTTILQQDSAFAANGFGDVLQDSTQFVADHLEALRAAFGLTSEEIARIVDQVVTDANVAKPPPSPLLTKQTLPLTLANISAIYRYGWLAHRLQLSVVEFLLLKKRTGFDVFAAPDPANPPIVQYLDVVQRLRQAPLRPTQALYLVWDDDISGKSAPDERQLTDLARTLRADLAAVESDFAIIDDPSGDIARARMTLVYGADATDFFFGLIDNTFVVNAKFSSPPASSPQPLIAAAPGRVAYDDFAKQLTFAGYLDAKTDADLVSAAKTDASLTKAVADIEAAANAALAPFLARFPKWKSWLDAYAAAPPTDSPEKRRAALLANILPELKRLRKREQVLAAISAAARTDLGFTTAILDDAEVLNAASDTKLTALDDFTTFDLGSSSAITKAFSGFIDPPQNALYDFAVDADPSITSVTLLVDGIDAVMAGGPGTWTNTTSINLTAGGLTSFKLSIIGTGALKARWIAQGQSWSEIPADRLYTAESIDHARTTYTRLLKTNALAMGVQLVADEVVYFAKRSDLQINFPTLGRRPWLNALPVGTDPSPFATDLRDRLITLLDFAALKAAQSPNDERLLAIFESPSSKAADGTLAVLALANWDSDSLTALLARFGKTLTDLSDVATFRRVHRSFRMAKGLGISASALLDATTNNPDPASVPGSHAIRDFESALRARYDTAAWLKVIQPINDALRVMCRDALVAYVLQIFRKQPKNTIDTPDKLFEYFLMDVQMDACMQTSRIRHALSSVQLFIERCLMNLEEKVLPTLLDAKQWEWMRRYRVWEANRKVFLWPENWLEPELRDHQSSIFKETMAELLQSDITEDTAEIALLNYLAKLEEIAKLEPCGVYYVDDKNVHLVARTSGAHRKYFYRQMENGSWLPWEQIKLDIDDNPVIPYLWNGRLLLFWLKVVKRAPSLPNVPSEQDPQKWTANELTQTPLVTVGAVLCWSERYNGKWQPTKTSNLDRPAVFRSNVDPGVIQQYTSGDKGQGTFSPFNRDALRLGITGEGADGLRIFVSDSPEGEGPNANWTSFLFLNTHSLPDIEDDNNAPEYSNVDLGDVSNGRLLDFDTSTDKLTIKFEFFDQRGDAYGNPPSKEDVLQSLFPTATRTVEPLQSLGDWNMPFLYQDGRHVFYVRPTSAPIEIPEPGYISFGPVQIARLAGDIMQRNTIDAVIHRQTGDPTPVGTRLSEDANINHILTGARTITFNGAVIGVAGVIKPVSNRVQ